MAASSINVKPPSGFIPSRRREPCRPQGDPCRKPAADRGAFLVCSTNPEMAADER
jgi:hypothetical protein